MSIAGNAITVGGGGSMSMPTVYVDNTTSTASGSSADFINSYYRVSGNGVVFVSASIFSDETSGYGTWIAEIYYNNVLIMADGTRLASADAVARPLGASTSAPIEVTNGGTIRISLQNTKTGTKTLYRRLLCFGCTVSAV